MDNAFWQAILDADGAIPEGHTVEELTPHLLAYLGSTDPFLRDEIAYPILDGWVHTRPTSTALALRDELLRLVGGALRALDPGFYAQTS